MFNPDDLPQEWLLLYLTAKYNGIACGVFAMFGVIFYGVSAVIFGRAIMIFWEKGLKSRATKLTLCACLVGFALITALTASLVTSSVVFPKASIALSRGEDAEAVLEMMNKQYLRVDISSAWPQAFLLLFSDAVIVWRTTLLFPDKKWLKVFLLCCWVGAFATALPELVLAENYEYWLKWFNRPSGLVYTASEVANYLSVLQNTVATVMISYRLWKHKNYLARTLNIRSSAQGVLLLLVETGLLFCVCQIASRVLQNLMIRNILADDSISGIMFAIVPGRFVYYLAGNYAAIVYILVNEKTSLSKSYVESISLQIPVDDTS